MKSKSSNRCCIICKNDKPETEFYRYAYTTNQGKRSFRFESRCKECNCARRRAQGSNPEQSRAWRTKNAERALRYAQAYRASPHGKAIRRALVIKRQFGQDVRTPSWADTDLIAEMFARAAELTAQTGVPHEVDHILPLQGKNVSGLHVHTNLQVLPCDVNRRKYNRFMEAA